MRHAVATQLKASIYHPLCGSASACSTYVRVCMYVHAYACKSSCLLGCVLWYAVICKYVCVSVCAKNVFWYAIQEKPRATCTSGAMNS